jgi:3-polyprenyl-4-hydroxybenzoate decarboxylase
VIIKPDMMGNMLNPSAVMDDNTHIPKITKIGVDATKPLNELERYEKIDISSEVKASIVPIIKKYCQNIKIF